MAKTIETIARPWPKSPPEKTAVPVDQAVAMLKQFNTTKFDQSVEIAIRLGIDPKQADQLVRGSIVLPHGIGKIAARRRVRQGRPGRGRPRPPAPTRSAADELAKKIKDGWTDFDACIAAPDMMGLVGPLGKVLGPRGLMPSPRAGTVTPDVGQDGQRIQGRQGRVPQRRRRHRACRGRQAELRRQEAGREHPGLHPPRAVA